MIKKGLCILLQPLPWITDTISKQEDTIYEAWSISTIQY